MSDRERLLDHLNSIQRGYEIDGGWFTDADALGPCPCFTLEIEGFTADGSCWRTCTHDGCCVHVTGDRVLAIRLKEVLDAMDWYGEWTLVYEDDE